jgi:type I restriction enzyme S subunit
MRQDLLGRLAMGSTHQTIYMPDIRSIRIPLPPVNEQDEIVEVAWSRFGAMDKLITATERHIGLLEERRQALITVAVTGAMEIPEGVAG